MIEHFKLSGVLWQKAPDDLLFIMNCSKCKDSGVVAQGYLGLAASHFCFCQEGRRLFDSVSQIMLAASLSL